MSCSLGDILVPTPIASVIIPAYNGANHLGEAIQSVLDQTYQDFELIVVDDASQDETALVIQAFDDPRLKYITHQENTGACNARKTGLHASVGEIIFFLDQDDLFHLEKLATHIDFHKNHPQIGFTYNAYYNLNHSSMSIRNIMRPPSQIMLTDIVMGFPLPPSVWVMKRHWAFLAELWDESTFFQGREIVFCGRLYLAGCDFAVVEGVLNFRRYHTGRGFHNLAAKCKAELTCQEFIFQDSRCPDDILALRNKANAEIYIMWLCVAFLQIETRLGQEYFHNAQHLDSSFVTGNPCPLTLHFLSYCLDDENENHEDLLRRIFDQLPADTNQIVKQQYDWAAAQGYLIKGFRAVMWDRPAPARSYFERAAELNARLDDTTIGMITTELINYEEAFGVDGVDRVIDNLAHSLSRVVDPGNVRLFKGHYFYNRAFENYRAGRHSEVPGYLLNAVMSYPKLLANRGTLSILFRSATEMLNQSI
jgi:glycosyltransferase involved in cell wall biosynthesis